MLNEAPSGHLNMSLDDRVVNALTGYLLLDMWQFLSNRECTRRRLPRGSLFMHPETVRNLQQTALGLLAVCLSKNREGSPWEHGRTRLCELPVEQWFAKIRSQSSTAQHSCRSYWTAACREMLRGNATRKVEPPTTTILEPLDPHDFFLASEKAFKSALRLVAWSMDCACSSLESAYVEWCMEKDVNIPDDDDENLGDEDGELACDNNPQAPSAFLSQMRAEVRMQEDESADFQVPDDIDTDLRKLPDKEALKNLLEGASDQGAEVDGPDDKILDMPRSLHQALWCLPPDSTDEHVFDSIWRLVMYLRHWKGGLDGQWIRNPRLCRRKASGLNWHQCLCRYVGLVGREKGLEMVGRRWRVDNDGSGVIGDDKEI